MVARASFPTINDAVEAVINILQAGIPIGRIELVDELSMKQVSITMKQVTEKNRHCF